jgi:lysophospholipase L1-like esterase
MPIIDSTTPLPVPTAQRSSWKLLHRIENTGGNVSVVTDAISNYPFERLIYAEGDSWFDKFTPIPIEGTNLLAGLRLPVFAGVVDVSHIGDISSEMVAGWQRRQTRTMFDLFDFDAILLSAGGNDLKNLFAELYQELGDQKLGIKVMGNAAQLRSLESGQLLDDFFDGVLNSIKAFIGLRDAAGSARTRAAPLIMHGYDYLQPRPAPAKIFAGSKLGAGPWLYPSLKHAGLSDRQMLDAAIRVIDGLNDRLRHLVSSLPTSANVWLLDQRSLLTIAKAGTTAESGDWLDEIHLTPDGYRKLAEQRWNPWLAKTLNLT